MKPHCDICGYETAELEDFLCEDCRQEYGNLAAETTTTEEAPQECQENRA